MTKNDYYNLMEHLADNTISCKVILPRWHQCFTYIVNSICPSMPQKAIDSLFYWFGMSNWTAVHQENTVYAGYSTRKLVNRFAAECFYISDRPSWDRLFRTHWLFLRAFEFNRYFNKMKY